MEASRRTVNPSIKLRPQADAFDNRAQSFHVVSTGHVPGSLFGQVEEAGRIGFQLMVSVEQVLEVLVPQLRKSQVDLVAVLRDEHEPVPGAISILATGLGATHDTTLGAPGGTYRSCVLAM